MNKLHIPARTRQELASPAPVGQRHAQIVKIVASLVGQGFSPDAVFAQLRGMYAVDVPDREITDAIRWASDKSFTPCAPRSQYRKAITSKSKTPLAVIDYAANIRKFLAGDTTNEADLWHVSPWRPLEDWRVDPIMFLAGMFHAGEMVNIVTDYTIEPKEDGTIKANPKGYGITLERDAMMKQLRDNGTPQSRAGAWLRMNPVDGKGVDDANVTAFRYSLLEIDNAPLDLQISVFAKLPLPVNAILLSGGKSCHAWVRLDAVDAAGYRQTVREILDVLKPLGVDQSNKNPSRLSRLVGAQRTIGGTGDGHQRLLYLAPDYRQCEPIFERNQ